jgi:hypothetical protein
MVFGLVHQRILLDHKVRKVQLDPKVLQGLKAHKDQQAPLDRPAHKVLKDQLVLKDRQAPLDHKAHKDRLVQQDHKALRV